MNSAVAISLLAVCFVAHAAEEQLECQTSGRESNSVCTQRGGICVNQDRCKSVSKIGSDQEQSTLCPSDGNGLPGGICCPKNDPANGRCNTGQSQGSVCMKWCGIPVRWPAAGCDSPSCTMCCTLV